jgi:hypothetical protein
MKKAQYNAVDDTNEEKEKERGMPAMNGLDERA